MKKLVLPLFLLFFVFVNSQEKISRNEIKLNALYSVAGIPEISYEYILNDESSLGASILFSIDNDNDILFAFTPNYRYYFGKKRAAGFFAETFGMLNITREYIYILYVPYPDAPAPQTNLNETNTDFALGFAIGGKFITKKEFLLEIYIGVGRNLFNSSNDGGVPRIGITLGKRF
jgi:hypothetical protein